MEWFKCAYCEKDFEKYRSEVSNPDRVFCSRNCLSEFLKIAFKGEGNPSYKHGKYVNVNLCGCGAVKDPRSERCAICANRSFQVGGEPIHSLDMELTLSTVKQSRSLKQAANLLGVPRRRLTEFVVQNNIDVTHMISAKGRVKPDKEIFVISEKPNRSAVRRRFSEITKIRCKCGAEDTWEGEPLVLQMDHINGDICDNRLENLRWLCPNCHSQTSTFCGRKGRGLEKPRKIENNLTPPTPI